jgi:para-nitrobenzyl esterase
VLAQYPLANYPSPDLAYATLITDLAFSCSALLTDQALSQYVRTYAYEFADENAPPIFPPVSFPQGAEHFSEVQYLFNLSSFGEPTVPFTPDQQRLSDTMIRYWTDFAKSGNPNSDEKEVPLWTKFSGPPAHEVLQSLLPPSPVSEPESVFSTDHKCAFWTPGLP